MEGLHGVSGICEVGTVIIPISQMSKLMPREVKSCLQSPLITEVKKQQERDPPLGIWNPMGSALAGIHEGRICPDHEGPGGEARYWRAFWAASAGREKAEGGGCRGQGRLGTRWHLEDRGLFPM